MKRKFLLLVMMCLFGGVYTSEIKAQFNVTYNQGAANQYTLTFTQLDENTCSVQMNQGNGPSAATDLVIPATIEHKDKTYSVVKIPNNAFSGASNYLGAAADNFTSLTIPNTVTSIGQNAFNWWVNCTTVSLGESLTYISKSAFANSTKITTIYCYAETPPECEGNSVFTSTVRNNAIVYVPANSIENYKKEISSGSGYGWAYILVSNISALSTTPTAPTAPTLNSPENGYTDIFNPSLDFTLGNSTTHYQILMAEASGTNIGEYSILQDWTKKTDNDVSYQTSHRKPNTTYYWKVIARNGEGDNALTTESSVYIFTTKQFSAPGAIEDAYPNGHTNLQKPKFTWTFGTDTEEYQILIDNAVVKDWTNPGSATTGEYQTSGLSSGEHTWRIDAKNSVDTIVGTEYSFSVISLPDNVTPVSPANGATGVTSNVVRFQFAPNTEEYRLLYDRGYGFEYVNNDENWVLTNNATTAEFEFPELEHSSTYYWAVDVKNDLGQRTVNEGGEEINTYSFTTNSILPVKYTSSKDDQITDVNTTLKWTYKGSAEKYQVLLGTTNPPTDIVQDWTEAVGTDGSFEATGLSNARYYWQVNVKSGEETVIYGDVMSFISLKKPGVPTVSQTKNPTTEIDPTSETTISWEALEGAQGYNVYLGTEKLNDDIISAENYTIAANTLQYNMNSGYDISVEAVYELGNSMSEAVNVKVTGTGLLNAKIVKSFNIYLGVDGATITLTQLEDEFENVYEGNGKQYTFTTNAEGKCNESVLNGIYKVEVSRKYYDTKTIDNVVFKQGETTNLSDSDVIPYVILKADPAYVFEVSIDDISFNSIHIYLENSEWETAPAGHYIVYLKNGDNIEKILTSNQDNPNPYFSSFGVESIRFKYEGWADLSKGSYQFGVATAADQINWSSPVSRDYAVFENDGNWSDEDNWNGNIVPDADDEVYVRAAATIAEGKAITAGKINIEKNGSLSIYGSLTAEAIYNNATADDLHLYDGGQLRQGNADLSGVFNMNIATPTNWNNTTNKDGWQFIASPFTDTDVEDWTTGSYYDFYKYDGTSQLEWINVKVDTNDFEKVFVKGRGYLASHESETITLSGTFNNATSYTWEGLTYNEANDTNDPSSQNLANFYLLGNPFTFNMDMTKASYNNLIEGVAIVNAEGGYTYVGVNQETTTIPVGDGFFVKVKEPQNATDVISLSYPARSSREKSSSINLVATSKAGQDNVVINFDGQAEGFDKLQNFNDEIATVCVVENDKAYGIYNCDSDVNEIEVTFVAKQMDSYSLSFDIKGEFETVTLVDRMTGVETDMIEESEYSFIATSKDMKNRFVVRLTNGQQPTANSQFVYQSGEELILSIEGSVQIVDMMGRVVYSAEHSNGSNRISVSEFNNAAYVVRVVNGNGVKTQKVVIY